MKVCVVSGDMPRNRIRMQPQCFIYNFSRALMDLNVSVRLITDGFDTAQVGTDDLEGVPIRRIKSVRHPLIVGNKELTSTITHEKPDIIFWHIGLTSYLHLDLRGKFDVPVVGIFTSPFYTIKDFVSSGLKTVITGFHDLWTGLLGNYIPSTLIRKGSNAFASIIVLSTAAKRGLIHRGINGGKIHLMPPAIDKAWNVTCSDNEFRSARQTIGLDADDFVVVFFGSPIKYRGSHTLVRAVSNAVKSIPKIKLLMLSRRKQGELTKEQQKFDDLIRRLGISKHVRIISDFLPQERLVELVASSNVVALPFEIAPSDIPLSVLEAMALGKPIISTAVDGIPDYLSGNRGIFIEPGNYDALALALCKIHKHPEYAKRIGENARSYMHRMPLWRDLAQEMMSKILPYPLSETYTEKPA